MKRLPLLVILLSIVLVSFRCECFPDFVKTEGKIINIYPDWCCLYEDGDESKSKIYAESGMNPAFGFSPWLDWLSDGKKMWQFVDKIGEVKPESFNGKFRVVTYGQRFSLVFSDMYNTKLDFFAYIGDYENYTKDRIVIIDTAVDEFEFDCYLRIGNSYNGFTNKCTDSNKGKVVMKKNESNDKEFRYIFYIGDEPVIDTIMTNQKYKAPDIIIDSETLVSCEWLPASFQNKVYDKQSDIDFSYGDYTIKFVYKKNNLYIQGSDYCYEGYSLRAIDKDNKKISFNLLDASANGYADYFEIHILDSNWSSNSNTYGSNTRMKGTLGYYKNGQDTPVRFFDETHSEIKRRGL